MTIKGLKQLLNKYPEDTPIYIQDLSDLAYYPIIDIQPFDSDNPIDDSNLLSIDFDSEN